MLTPLQIEQSALDFAASLHNSPNSQARARVLRDSAGNTFSSVYDALDVAVCVEYPHEQGRSFCVFVDSVGGIVRG
jgi:hypothetical protein